MNPVWLISLYIVFVGLNFCIAWSNDQTRRYRIAHKITKQINHFVWGAAYTAACLVPLIWFSWPFSAAIFLQHICFFPIFYNAQSGQDDIFHLSTTTTALTDRILVKLGFKTTEAVNLVGLFASLGLLTYALFKL